MRVTADKISKEIKADDYDKTLQLLLNPDIGAYGDIADDEIEDADVENLAKPRKRKTYYDIGPEFPIEDIIDNWQQNNSKGYDEHIHRYYSYPELEPYKEFDRTRDEGNLSQQEWSVLKDSLSRGFDDRYPLIFYVGAASKSYVGEGNHRLAIIDELYSEDPEKYEELYSRIPVRFIFVQ